MAIIRQWFVFVAVCGALWLLGLTSPQAQVVPKVDYYNKTIIWDWAPGAPPLNGMATHFNVKCGPAPGQYTFPVKRIDLPAKSIAIRDAVPVQGLAYCTITAANDYGESQGSVEIPFSAGSAPTAPTNARLQ